MIAISPALIVSIHDVSPRNFQTVQTMLNDLYETGVEHTSLLVIPNHHHLAPILEAPEFIQTLNEWQNHGHEIVLHGYYHLRPPADTDSGIKKLIASSYTSNEGEFLDLSYDQAHEKLSSGLADFAQVGWKPTGFIAPAWLFSEPAEQAARDLGFLYTTRLTEIKNLQTNTSIRTQSLVYSTRAKWRVTCSLAWNAWLKNKLKHHPVVRLGIHPPDIDHPEVWKQILKFCRQFVESRAAITYYDWVSQCS